MVQVDIFSGIIFDVFYFIYKILVFSFSVFLILDINLWKWNETAQVIAALPFIPGHEAVGVVEKCGPKKTFS